MYIIYIFIYTHTHVCTHINISCTISDVLVSRTCLVLWTPTMQKKRNSWALQIDTQKLSPERKRKLIDHFCLNFLCFYISVDSLSAKQNDVISDSGLEAKQMNLIFIDEDNYYLYCLVRIWRLGKRGSDLKNNDCNNQKKRRSKLNQFMYFGCFELKKSKDRKLTIRICFDPFTTIAATSSFFFLILQRKLLLVLHVFLRWCLLWGSLSVNLLV